VQRLWLLPGTSQDEVEPRIVAATVVTEWEKLLDIVWLDVAAWALKSNQFLMLQELSLQQQQKNQQHIVEGGGVITIRMLEPTKDDSMG
jgi:hypothetical protein